MRSALALSSSLLALSLLASRRVEAQSYGFIARLGRDTVAVERLTRNGARITGDVIERSQRVVHRHYEAELAANGSVNRYTIDIRILNPAPGRPATQHVEARFVGDSIHVTSKIDNDTAQTQVLATNGKLVMPWLIYGYGAYEATLNAALKRPGDSIPVDYYTPGGGLMPSFVRRLGGGSASLGFFGSPFLVKLDAQGRLQSLSGAATTIKVEVERLAKAPDVPAITAAFAAQEKAAGRASLMSARDTTVATIGTASLLVDYGRPMARGRTILGNIVPYGEVWRTGANAATQFTTSASITLGGLELAPGTYTLWTLPTATGVQLIVNKQTKQWGTEYHAEQDLGRVAAKAERLGSSVEKFTISLVPSGATNGTLVLEWDTFRWSIPMVVR